MRRIKPIIIPCLIVLFSFALRMSLISRGPYNVDSLGLVISAEKTLETFELQRLSQLGFPLTVILGTLFTWIFKVFSLGDAVQAVNFMSVIFSSLGILCLYGFVKNYFNETVATISSILFSLCPIFLGVSVYGKSHSPSLFFLFLSLYLLLVYSNSQSKKYFLGSAMCLGFMGASRIIDLVLMAIPVSFLFFFMESNVKQMTVRRVSNQIKSFIYFWLIAMLTVVLFYLPYVFQHNLNTYTQQFSQYLEYGLNNYLGINPSSLGVTFRFFVDNFRWLGIFVAAAGLLTLLVQDKKRFAFLFLWAVCPVIYYGNLQTTVTSRYFVISLAPLTIAQGYFFLKMIKHRHMIVKWPAYISIVLLLLMMYRGMYPILKFRHQHALLPEFMEWVGRHTEVNARIISTDEAVFTSYYANRSVLYRPRINVDTSNAEALNAFKSQLDSLLDKGVPVYITTVSMYSYNYKKQFSDFFKKNYRGELIGQHFYEDWHQGAMNFSVTLVRLYKIEKWDIRLEKKESEWIEEGLYGYTLWE